MEYADVCHGCDIMQINSLWLASSDLLRDCIFISEEINI